jgi:hypothetical protein
MIIRSVLLFTLAGLAEIGGGYLIWLWLRGTAAMGWAGRRTRGSALGYHSNLPAAWSGLRQGIRRLWWRLHCPVTAVGVDGRWGPP